MGAIAESGQRVKGTRPSGGTVLTGAGYAARLSPTIINRKGHSTASSHRLL